MYFTAAASGILQSVCCGDEFRATRESRGCEQRRGVPITPAARPLSMLKGGHQFHEWISPARACDADRQQPAVMKE
jgi:hypothetical protein